MLELYLRSSNMPSWFGAQLKKHRDNFTFTLVRKCVSTKLGVLDAVIALDGSMAQEYR
jgi:hypothetical protein